MSEQEPQRCGEPQAMIWLGVRALYGLGILGLLVWAIKQALES